MALSLPMSLIVLGSSIAITAALTLLFRRRNVTIRPLPPGPGGFLLLGNINDMPKPGEPEWEHWLQHKDLYGPISSVTILGQTIIIINDPQIAFDLLRDRSSIYSSRPSQVFSVSIVGLQRMTVMLPYAQTWKTHRKTISKVTSTVTSLKMFDRVQEAESAHFLLNVLESPDKLTGHLRKEAGTVMLRILYGYTAKAHESDPLVDLVNTGMSAFSEAMTPGRWRVDVLPLMRYLPESFPGCGFDVIGRQMSNTLTQMVDQPALSVCQATNAREET